MVLIDATTLLLFLSPLAEPPRDPATNLPIEHAQLRVEHLVKSLEAKRTKILVPAPALSEVLVRAGTAGQQYVRRIERSSVFRTVPFDTKAAIEVATMTREAIENKDKRDGADGTWAKIKYDRQIVAIAKVHGVEAIYSDDGNIRSFATRHDIPVIGLRECQVPQESLQGKLQFEVPSETERSDQPRPPG
jgi:predicted nucleic acid-binding protein